MFEGYLGQALHVARISAGLTQDEVLDELKMRMRTSLSSALFDSMERDIEEIDAQTFDTWCEILPWRREKVLKCAQFLQQNAHRPERELLEDLLSETEYQLWRDGPENQ